MTSIYRISLFRFAPWRSEVMSGVNFSNQADAKQYAKRVGVEYRYGCFEEKKPDACHLLGDYLEAVEQNYSRARHIYEENCFTSNYAPSCYKFGKANLKLSKGENVPKLDIAIDALQRSCDGKFLEGCHWLADLSLYGTPSRPANARKAAQVLETNCDNEYADSCWWASSLHQGKMPTKNPEGDPNAVPVNFEKAFNLASKGCDMSHFQCCSNLSLMLRKGEGCIKDEKKADEMLNKAKLIAEPVIDKYTIQMTG